MITRQQISAAVEERNKLVDLMRPLSERDLSEDEGKRFDELMEKVSALDKRIADMEGQAKTEDEQKAKRDADEAKKADEEKSKRADAEAAKAEEEKSKRADAESQDTADQTAGGGTRSAPGVHVGGSGRRTLPPALGGHGTHQVDHRADWGKAFRSWSLGEQSGVEPTEARNAAFRVNFNLNARQTTIKIGKNQPTVKEARALSTQAPTGGQTTVQTTVATELEKQLLFYCQMREVSKVMRTDQGNPLQIPTTSDGAANEGDIIAENAAFALQDVPFGSVTIGAFKFTSKVVQVSIEMLQDPAIDIEAELGALLGERLGRAQGRKFTVGTGGGEPQGVVHCRRPPSPPARPPR